MRLRRDDLLPADVEKHFEGEPGGADAAARQDNGNSDQAGKADATDRCHRAATGYAVLLVG
jgi:hypothetical protein